MASSSIRSEKDGEHIENEIIVSIVLFYLVLTGAFLAIHYYCPPAAQQPAPAAAEAKP